ncbi:MAG: PF20097 family protein [Oscillospiraceae bacterium]|jgi:hypothetical protein|nr:PF20097 family protein [Oscillospiraceae bacterium]
MNEHDNSQALICPVCGQEMEEGYILAARGTAFPWLPKKAPFSWFYYSYKRLYALGGILLLGKEHLFKMSFAKLPVSICRKCGQGRFTFNVADGA